MECSIASPRIMGASSALMRQAKPQLAMMPLGTGTILQKKPMFRHILSKRTAIWASSKVAMQSIARPPFHRNRAIATR